jgi:prepilin-type processing-associated H-X9-DG protein
LDEHPDSINDGYFLNRASAAGGYTKSEWTDLPASYHDGAGSFSFADGHGELHRWLNASTKRPSLPMAAQLPSYIKGSDSADFKWVMSHMSVDSD